MFFKKQSGWLVVASFICLFLLPSCNCAVQKEEYIYQYSVLAALTAGAYDGQMTFGELREHGGFGLGTFDALDGEMLALDGAFYQIKIDGKVYRVTDEMETPFAVVTSFSSDISFRVKNNLNYNEFKDYLDSRLPTENLFYAVKGEGSFTRIKVRSVPRQEKPYPPLLEVVKEQKVFELNNVKGTLVGFRCPEYVAGLNVSGYHFHFITDDRKAGGHVLDLQIGDIVVDIDQTAKFDMILPETNSFYQMDFSKSKTAENKTE